MTTNEIKRGPAQTAAADLLPNESHATANISLLACLQKLSTATLNSKFNHCPLIHFLYILVLFWAARGGQSVLRTLNTAVILNGITVWKFYILLWCHNNHFKVDLQISFTDGATMAHLQ